VIVVQELHDMRDVACKAQRFLGYNPDLHACRIAHNPARKNSQLDMQLAGNSSRYN
jgi:hypothetical protein